MPKFCPECGSPLNDKTICECGYDVTKQEVDSKIREEQINKFKDQHKVENCLGAIPLENLKQRKLDTGKLLTFSYSRSGGMQGEYHHKSLNFEKKELEVVNQDWHHGEKTKIVYKAPDIVVEELKNILIDNNFRAWSEVAVDMSMRAFDAPSSSIGLTFENLSVNISTLIYMDDEERELYWKVIELLNSIEDDSNKISEEILEEGTPFGSMLQQADITNDPIAKQIGFKFCPECGGVVIKNINTCICGYKFEDNKEE